MALFRKMKLVNITPTILPILPSIALIPIVISYLLGFHAGGLDLVIKFFISSTIPSLEPIVLSNAWTALQVTFSTALISWTLSSFIGIFLGILSSNIFWESIGVNSFVPKILKLVKICLIEDIKNFQHFKN